MAKLRLILSGLAVTALWCAALPVQGATVAFARGAPDPSSRFTLLPEQPRVGDTVTFFDPFGWKYYSNECEAFWTGTPSLAVDPAARTVELILGPRRTGPCPFNIDLHSGLRGEFVPLSAGTWTYSSRDTRVAFTVAVPEPAGTMLLLPAAGAGLLTRNRRRV